MEFLTKSSNSLSISTGTSGAYVYRGIGFEYTEYNSHERQDIGTGSFAARASANIGST